MDLVVLRTGYGIGGRDGEIPNVLRVYLAEDSADRREDVEEAEAVMLECNMDDMNPEWYSHVTALLFEAGAADVFMIPIVMKKSRPGHMLSVLSDRDKAAKMKEILFKETSSIGLREYEVKKSMLRREVVKVNTRFGEIEVKRSFFGGRIVNEKAEFDQCSRLAKEYGVTLEEIRKEVYKKL
jgi:uncharacterized protein (DUF111 family)